MPSSPLQFVNARNLIFPLPGSLRRCRKRRCPIGAALGQQRPGDPRHLVGKGDRNNLERSPRQKLCQPGILLWLLARPPQDSTGSNDQDAAQVAIALFRDRPELLFAAGRVSRGTMPIQAAKSRPDRKTFGSGTTATIVLAPRTPMPGIV